MRLRNYITEQDESYDEIVIKVKGEENQELIKLLNAIKIAGNIGHSATVVMDPDIKEYKQDFFFDGDGAFYMKSLKLNGQEYKG
jgi:hypothetical protein